jgi:hypothetical protein
VTKRPSSILGDVHHLEEIDFEEDSTESGHLVPGTSSVPSVL